MGTCETDLGRRLEEDQVFPSEGLCFPNDNKMRALVERRACVGSWRNQEKKYPEKWALFPRKHSRLLANVKCPFEAFIQNLKSKQSVQNQSERHQSGSEIFFSK